uniref:Uncharacterized protein n=1 Tax=Avena sativa TaxID=4498 RepID=A0ACD5WL25_AVESA
MKASTRRRQGRRTAGEEGCFSLGQCTGKHMSAEEAATGEEGAFSLRSCSTTQHMEVEEAATGKKGTFSLMPCTATGEDGSFSLGQCATKHMALEEPVIGEEGALNFSLRPCATKLVAAEEVGPSKGYPTKRKAAARFPKAGECEPLDMFPERERSSLMEPMQMIFAPMLRERVKASLLTFPEVAALDTEQLEVAVDRIIRQSTPETASPTSPGMCRLSDQDIAAFFYHKTEIPTIDDLAPAGGGAFPAGWIEERRKQLDAEVQPAKKKFGQDLDVLLAKIRVDLLTKGYVEVPEMYFEEHTPDVQAARMEQAARKEYTGVAGPDDEEWWLDDTAVVLTKLIIESS